MRQPVLFALVAFLAAVVPAVAAEPAPPMAAHQAVYDLTAGKIRGTQISAVSGKMAYEVIDACDGWAGRQRLEMTVTNRNGQDIQMVSDYTTWESKDGRSLRFQMRQTTDGAVTTDVAGEAALDKPDGEGQARYTLPHPAVKPLPPGTLFPMRHTEAIISAARAGRKFLPLPLFDGTDDAGAQRTSVVVLSWGHETDPRPELKGLASGRVHIAFFDSGAADAQPDYEASMRYWENGIADDLEMDFGDFVAKGKLTRLTLLPSRC